MARIEAGHGLTLVPKCDLYMTLQRRCRACKATPSGPDAEKCWSCGAAMPEPERHVSPAILPDGEIRLTWPERALIGFGAWLRERADRLSN